MLNRMQVISFRNVPLFKFFLIQFESCRHCDHFIATVKKETYIFLWLRQYPPKKTQNNTSEYTSISYVDRVNFGDNNVNI